MLLVQCPSSFFLMFINFWETQIQSASEEEAERETHTHRIWRGSRLRAVSTEPGAGLTLTNREIMTWGEVGRLTDWATLVPLKYPSSKDCELLRNSDCFSCTDGTCVRSGTLVEEHGDISWSLLYRPNNLMWRKQLNSIKWRNKTQRKTYHVR